jgi:short-subunit dehydrogenase
MTNVKEKYGPTTLADRGLDLILIARRPEPLAEITPELTQKFGVHVIPLPIDLAADPAANKWITFFMQHILSKKAAIRMMSNGLKKVYRIILRRHGPPPRR